MTADIQAFLDALGYERGLSSNTQAAYRRDLEALAAYLSRIGVTTAAAVTRDAITAFLQDQRQDGRGAPPPRRWRGGWSPSRCFFDSWRPRAASPPM
jgi:site-specific recombinase XerC